MKKTLTIMAAALCLLVSVSCSTPRNYTDLAKCKGVTMVYLGQGMTSAVASAISDAIGDEIDVADMKITGVRVIKADGGRAVRNTRAVVMDDVRRLGAVPLLEIGLDRAHRFGAVYGKPNPATGGYSHLLIVGENYKQGFAFVFQGNFTAADVERLDGCL